MQELQKLETAVLENMIAAHSYYYGRILSEEESTNCKFTIELLQSEIKSRGKEKAVFSVDC